MMQSISSDKNINYNSDQDLEVNKPTKVTNLSNPPQQSRSSSTTRRGQGGSMSWCDTQPKKIAWGCFIFVLLITAATLLGVSLKKVESTEYGLEYNIHSKQLDAIAKVGGLHLGPPGYEFIKFPSTFITVDLPSGTCVSRDGLRVEFSVTFQYQMPREWMLPAILKYRNFDKWVRTRA